MTAYREKDEYFGGYEFTLQEIATVSCKLYNQGFDRINDSEAAAMTLLEEDLGLDFIRCGPSVKGPITYILVSQWNKTGEGFPFKQNERDAKLQKFVKDKIDLDCENHRWVTVKNPSIVC